MVLIVVFEGASQVLHGGSSVRFWHEGDVVALDGLDEGLGHAIALRRTDRRGQGRQTQVAGELARLVRHVRRAVVSEPFYGPSWRGLAEPPFDGRQHDVAHEIAGLPARGGRPAHRFPIAAVQGEGRPHRLAVVATELEPVRAPAHVAGINSNTAIVAAWGTHRPMSTGQQTVIAHDAVDALVVDRRAALGLALAPHKGPGASIPVTGQMSHGCRQFLRQLGITGLANRLGGTAPCPGA